MLNQIKRSTGEKILDGFILAMVILIIFMFLYPLIFVLFASLSDPRLIYESPLLIWPKGFNITSYIEVFKNSEIWIAFKNTIIYTTIGTFINIFMTTLGAYPLSRDRFYGKNVITFFIVLTMFFSGGLIPLYLVNQQLGLMNTMWALVLPPAISVFNLVIMRTYFQTNLPKEVEESAFVDGATEFQLLYKIVLPLSTPIIAVLILFYGVAHWNSYFEALIYLTDREKFPLQLILREILVQNSMEQMLETAVDAGYADRMIEKQSLKYAVVIVSTLPLLILYPLLSKFFEKGIMVGSLKG
ncbi:carbohydrate ABC transporter permease [Lederbergia galactosidilytica]|uniref:carbohydrate ABC transporter permease n=1 Tax=Lederbergia galactosidilytica TaxID=217031 RepID=UPI0009EDE3D3|nr:carbohydrate ABC transporter permease [Lederbergia galactosidilytica]MBP1915836.1 putative aldouronate transport system permease protein [Lederbergia galactosidilytica]